MAKAPTAAERRHHARIREMGCLVCRRPASVHHLRHDGYKGISKDHRLVVGLCGTHHQHGPHAIHTIGHRQFEELFDCSLFPWAVEQWIESNG